MNITILAKFMDKLIVVEIHYLHKRTGLPTGAALHGNLLHEAPAIQFFVLMVMLEEVRNSALQQSVDYTYALYAPALGNLTL